MEKDVPCNIMKVGVTTLISDKADFRAEYCQRQKVTFHNNKGLIPLRRRNNLKCMHKFKLQEIKVDITERRNKCTIRDFLTVLSVSDGTSRGKTSKFMEDFNNTQST